MADLGTPRLTFRRLRNVLRRLPRTSQFWIERDGPAWSTTDQLLDLLLYVQQVKAMDPKDRHRIDLLAPKQHRRSNTNGRSLTRAQLAAWKAGRVPI